MISAQPPQSTAAISAAQIQITESYSPAPLHPKDQTYYNRLHPCCIILLLPKLQRVVMGRFRRRNDAESHLKILQQMNPDAEYLIIFDPPDRSLF